ncbi:autotransporter-associated beta strand repeat-containing protein [Verrucomicrobium sp. BvORR106]|uniref:beta strand repeat-containing protein n=1 Tax=Verrucomicrobium sp. BvORR106 TaxID=1403819 RepID=UPI002240FB46|nr:autotransporter-associated beta strand repeat-containing protein [Verrucomicrobium sp. BvORR106]
MKKSLSRDFVFRYAGFYVRCLGMAALMLLQCLTTAPGYGATYTWQTAGTTNGWSTAAGDTNWFVDSGTTLATWLDGNAAVFNATTDTTVTVTGVVSPTSITFGSGWANNFAITGGTISFGSLLGVIDSSAVTRTGARTITISSSLTGTGGLTLNAHGDLTGSGGGNGAYLALGGNNTGLTGGIAITGGLVDAVTSAAFGNNTITLSNFGGILDANHSVTLANNIIVQFTGGTLRTWGSATMALNGAISGTGALNHTDSGKVVLAGDLSGYSGAYSNLAGTTVIDTNSSLTGSVSITGALWVGNNSTRGSLRNATSIAIAASSSLQIRRSDTVNASDILPTNITFAATSSVVEYNPTSATAVMNLDMALGSSTTLGTFRVSGGTVNLVAGGSVTVNSVSIGLQSSTNRGTLNIGVGSSLTTAFFNIGADGSNSGTVNQTGGLVTLVAGGNGFRLGHWTNGTNPANVYNLTGGVLDGTALSANSGSARYINIGWDGNATMVVGGGGGAATLKAFGISIDASSQTAGADTLTVKANGTVEIGTGGTVTTSATDAIILDGGTLKATAASTWAATIDAGAGPGSVLDTNGVVVSLTGNMTGSGIITVADSSGSSGVLNFAPTSGTQTISASLAGTAAMTKTGAGTTVWSGAGTYSGTITASAGALVVSGNYASANVSLAATASLGGEGTVGSLNSSGTLLIDPTTIATSLAITGNAVFNSGALVDFSLSPTATGQAIRVFSYGGSLTGLANLALVGAANYRNAVFSNSGGVVSLTLGNKSLVWNGASGGQWQVGVSRWATGEADAFYWADNVRFDDTGTNPSITLTGELRPASIVVDSDVNQYTFTGSTGNFIGGLSSLYKSGSSTLTLNGPNTFSGGTIISEGTVAIRTASSLGTGTITLGDALTGASNVALYQETSAFTLANSVIVSANGTGTVTIGSNVFTGAAKYNSIILNRDVIFDSNASDRTDYNNISGTGNIRITGTKRTIFTTTNTFVGDVTVATSSSAPLQLGVVSTNNYIPDASNVTVLAGAIMNLSLGTNGVESINGLFGAGTIGTNSGTGNVLLVGAANGNGDYSGLLQHTIGFTKAGTGTQKLTHVANTYTGVTSVTGGVLEVSALANGGSNSSIGASSNAATSVVLNGGVLRYVGGDVSTDRRFTIGTAGGGVESSGSGALTLAAVDALTLSGTNAARTFTLGGTNTAANTFAGIIGDNGTGATAFTKSGVGSWVLNGLSTYTGVTTVSAGTLNVSVIANGGVASNIGQSAKAASNLVLNGGTLRFTGASTTTDRAFQTGTSGGTIDVALASTVLQFGSASTPFSFGGTLTKTGEGTLRFVSYSGSSAAAATDLIINQGAVEFGTGYFNSSPFGKYGLFITVNTGGILRTTTSHALGGDNIEAGTSLGQIRLLGGTFQVNGTQYLSSGLVSGEGRLVLQGGVVEGSADLRSVPNGATITTLASSTTSEIRNVGGINLQYGALVTDVADGEAAVDLWISSVISHVNNGVTKNGAGVLELTGANTYGGGTTVNAGTLLVNNTAADQSGVGTGAFVVAAGATAGGRGAILANNANITINGTLSIGNNGDDLFTSDLNLHLGTGTGAVIFNGVLVFDIFGQEDDTLGSEHGQLYGDVLKFSATGSVQLGGTLKVNDATSDALNWNEGDSWQLIDWTNVVAGTITGSFSNYELPTLAEGLKWDTSLLAETGVISVTVVPEPGRMLLLLLAGGLLLVRRKRKVNTLPVGFTTRA